MKSVLRLAQVSARLGLSPRSVRTHIALTSHYYDIVELFTNGEILSLEHMNDDAST